MNNAQIDSSGNLLVTPSATSNKNDFNFLIGEFNVRHKKLKSRLTGSNDWIESDGTHKLELLLTGIGNLEQHRMVDFNGEPFEGVAFRLFNPATRLWSIYWADSRYGTIDTPMVGSFEKNIGYFFAKDNFNERPILIQFLWDATVAGEPVWSQAFSADDGKTWEWNWYMYFKRK